MGDTRLVVSKYERCISPYLFDRLCGDLQMSKASASGLDPEGEADMKVY